jgi:hypothetical protein
VGTMGSQATTWNLLSFLNLLGPNHVYTTSIWWGTTIVHAQLYVLLGQIASVFTMVSSSLMRGRQLTIKNLYSTKTHSYANNCLLNSNVFSEDCKALLKNFKNLFYNLPVEHFHFHKINTSWYILWTSCRKYCIHRLLLLEYHWS